MIRALLVAAATLLLFAPAARSQAAGPDDVAATFPGFAPGARVDRFLQDAGEAWRVRWDLDRGVPRLLFGGRDARDIGAGTALDFERTAREVVDDLSAALGYTSQQLELVRVKTLALSRIGSSDKVVVKFHQVNGGIPTHQGYVNVLFGAGGELLAVDNQALPHAAQVDRFPTHGFDAAARVARAAFAADTGLPAVQVEAGDYVLFPAEVARGTVRAVPAYNVIVHGPEIDRRLVRRNYAVAARGTPRVLDAWDLVHDFDLNGTVSGWGQAGLLPQTADPEVLLPLQGVTLSATGESDVLSASDGSFSFPGVNTSKTVTAVLDGPYSQVLNDQGAEATVSLSVSPGSPGDLVFNTSLSETETAEVNTHFSIHRFRNWVKSIDPTETMFDFPIVGLVMVADTCNAQWVGDHMRFYNADTECVNTAYSTVVYHEEGHWANSLYGFGNSSTGIGEGGADIWAMYISDDPVVGDGFKGPGTIIRTGLNTEPYCGDDAISCYGGSHANGEPLMGAAWKIRQRLKDTLGTTPGSDAANLLMLSWYQTFNDTVFTSIVREHWLLLDDDNGDLGDLTPHFSQIEGGFTDQAFPAFKVPVFQLAHAVTDLVPHDGPVTLQADIAEVHDTVAFADLVYSTDGGQSWSTAPMGFVSGATWSAQIPAQPSPAVVTYYVQATSVGGFVNVAPPAAPAEVFHFDRGSRNSLSAYDFDALDDEDWTHLELLDQDDWQRGEPQGLAGDPAAAYSGANVWGNDLGEDGWNGAYRANVHNKLVSPVFDMTGASNVHLRFQRWLTVEESEYDQARILVNGTPVWENPFSGHVYDQSWNFVDYDISALADDNPSVQIEFELVTDGGLQFGGWNIDDLQLVSLGAASETSFVSYGTGTPGFGGGAPELSGSGQAVPGGPVSLSVTGARPGAVSALFVGTDEAALPGFGGTFLVTPLVLQLDLFTNGSGEVLLVGSLPNDPLISGVQITQQFWAVDPDAVFGFAASNGLKFTIQ